MAIDWTEWLASPIGQQWSAGQQEASGYKTRELDLTEEKTRAEITAAKRKIDAEYETLKLTRGKYAADAWYQQQQVRLSEMAHQLDRDKFGFESQTKWPAEFGLEQDKFGLEQTKTGVDALSRISQLRNSPGNYFELADLAAGMKGRQDIPVFVQRALAGAQAPGFQQAGGPPSANGLGDTLRMLGIADPSASGVGQVATQQMAASGQGAAPTAKAPTDPRSQAAAALVKALPPSASQGLDWQDTAALAAINAMYEKGGHQLEAGTMESMDPSEIELIASGGKRLGYDPARLGRAYKASRPVQGSNVWAA